MYDHMNVLLKSVQFRTFKSVDFNKLNNEITRNFALQNDKCINEVVRNYNETLTHLIDSFAPIKVKTFAEKTFVPWMNDEIFEAKRKRRKCENVWRKSGLTVHHHMYKHQKSIVVSLIKQAKAGFYAQEISNCNKDQSKLFRCVTSSQTTLFIAHFCYSKIFRLFVMIKYRLSTYRKNQLTDPVYNV